MAHQPVGRVPATQGRMLKLMERLAMVRFWKFLL